MIRGENYGRSCDIWSLGCTFIEMSSGRPPWSNEYSEITAVMFHIASSNDIPHLPSHLDFSPEAHDFILRCLKRNPSERPSPSILLAHAFIKSLDFTFPSSMNNNNTSSTPSNGNAPSQHGDHHAVVKERALTGSRNSTTSNTTGTITTVSKLPTEILLHIFSFLEEQNYKTIACVCKNWKLQMEDDMIWRYKTLLHWKKAKKPTETKWRVLYTHQKEHDLHWFYSPLNSISFKGKTHAKSINTIAFCIRGSSGNGAANNSNSGSPILDGVNYIITGSDDKKVKFWNINKAKMTKSLKGHTGSVNSICLTDNTTKLLTASSDKTIKLWDVKEVKNKKNIKTFEGHKDSVTCVQCNIHASKFASASLDKTIMLWDMHTGKLLSTLEGHKGGVNSIFLTDHTIVSASADSTVKIYDTRIEKCTRSLIGHVADVTCLQFDPDTNTLLSGSLDKTIREWDIASGVCTNIIKANESINCLYFDQNKIICGSHDKTLKIWNRHEEKSSPTVLKGHSDIILSLAFASKCILGSQSTDILASAGRDKKPLLWLPQSTSSPK